MSVIEVLALASLGVSILALASVATIGWREPTQRERELFIPHPKAITYLAVLLTMVTVGAVAVAVLWS